MVRKFCGRKPVLAPPPHARQREQFLLHERGEGFGQESHRQSGDALSK
jgi:hypothetical protein